MTTEHALENCRRAAEWLQWRAAGDPPVPPTHVLLEWSASIAHLANTWRPTGEEAGIALTIASKARRQLAAMSMPAEHVAEHAIRGMSKRGGKS